MGRRTGDSAAVKPFAAVFALGDEGWTGADADLTEVMTFEDLADLMREAAVEISADTVVLLASGDRWFGVVRITGQSEPRIFLSDADAAAKHPPEHPADRIAALLSAQADRSGRTARVDGAVAGDPELLRDLGPDGAALVALSERRETGRDALHEVIDRAGMRDAYARLG